MALQKSNEFSENLEKKVQFGEAKKQKAMLP